MSGQPAAGVSPTASVVAVDLRRLLLDGRWHKRDQVVNLAARSVPPGVAYRAIEARRISKYVRRTGVAERDVPPRSREYDAHQLVSMGSRLVAAKAVHSGIARGSIEEDDSRTLVRLSPRARQQALHDGLTLLRYDDGQVDEGEG